MTALRLLKAARAGDEAEIEALIARGVKGTRKQLVEAARAGETHVVEVLLRSGTRGTREQLDAARETGETDVVEVLLRSGAAGAGGRLLAAQRRGDSAEIEALKREGAPAQADFGRAVVDNDVELARALLVLEIEALKREGAPAQPKFQRALERALQVDDVEIMQTLLAAGADPNAPHSALHGEAIGTTARSPAALAALIDAGADLNAPLPPDSGLSIPFRLCHEASSLPHPKDKFTPADRPAIALAMLKLALARGMNPNARYRKRKSKRTGYVHGGETLIEHVARGGWQGSYPVSTEAGRRALVATIEALIDAGADTSEALARFRRSAARGGPALDSSVMAALERTPRAPANAPADSAAAFEAEKRAHPPPAAPASQPNGGFWSALTIAGGLALLLALVTCAARPAPAAEADSPGWRFVEAVDGDTLAFAVDALPPVLARVLVRVRGVDTPETRRPKCAWERGAGTIALADLAWGKYGGRVLARAPVDGADIAEAIVRAGHGRAYDGARRARGAAA